MVVIVLCGLALFWLYESCLFIYLIFTFFTKRDTRSRNYATLLAFRIEQIIGY